MTALKTLSNVMLLVGICTYGWVSFFRRVPGAPGVGGGGRQLPWQRAEWFTARDYRVRLVGYVLWMLGTVGVVVTSFLSRSSR